MTIFKELFSNLIFLGLISGLVTFLISTKLHVYQSIISISKSKGLMDAPDERKVHSTQIPTLGGLGVFISFSLSVIVFGLIANLGQPDLTMLLALIGAAIILLFVGIKDDLVSMSPKKKLIGQLLAVFTVVVLTDVRIFNLEGLLGIGELPYFVSVLFSIFVFVLVINAVNLIDGIDGLSGSIGIVASASFGVLFLFNGDYMMTIISFTLVGALLGFLKYNLSTNQKIFMGDCGSMVTGFLVAYQGICFLAVNHAAESSQMMTNAPILLIAILSYPLFDLLRVFTVRIAKGMSPFNPDSNHIHHRLLRLGLNHKSATLLLVLGNVSVIGFTFIFTDLEIHLQLVVTVITGVVLYLLPFLKVFETNLEVNLGAKKVVPVPVVSDNFVKYSFAKKDTFEFDFKPLIFFEEDKKQLSTHVDSVRVNNINDIDVIVEAREVKREAPFKIDLGSHYQIKNRRDRLLAKRKAAVENLVKKEEQNNGQ